MGGLEKSRLPDDWASSSDAQSVISSIGAPDMSVPPRLISHRLAPMCVSVCVCSVLLNHQPLHERGLSQTGREAHCLFTRVSRHHYQRCVVYCLEMTKGCECVLAFIIYYLFVRIFSHSDWVKMQSWGASIPQKVHRLSKAEISLQSLMDWNRKCKIFMLEWQRIVIFWVLLTFTTLPTGRLQNSSKMCYNN